MKKNLTKQNTRELYFYKDGVKKIVDYKDKSTYPSELYGDISGLYGDCDNIKGDLDDCDITDEDRKKGIDIQNLIIS